jgi:hypothetical protein
MNSLTTLVRFGKNLVLPKGVKFRTLPLGLAAGCVMRLDLHTGFRVYVGLYERELAPHFRSLVRAGYNSFDVGGKGGYYALLLGKLSRGKVISFECEKAAAEEMRQTFARNPYPIQTVEGFVGDASGGENVTLDEVAARTFVPDFIKMDIEGAETKALRGAQAILAGRKPSLIIEVHGREIEDECLELLKGHGYSPVVVDQGSLLQEDRPLEHNRWLVCAGRP